MGHNVSVHCHTCGEILNHGNDSLPGGLGALFDALGVPVLEWGGKTGVDVLPALQCAVTRITDADEREDLRREHDTRMGTPGEWSRVDFAARFLPAMRDAICRDPYASVSVR
jgi:hypothetical protein